MLVGVVSDFGWVADLVELVLDFVVGTSALVASVFATPVAFASAAAGALDAAGCAGDVSVEPAVVLAGAMLSLDTSRGCATGVEDAGSLLAAGVSLGADENIIL